MNIYGSFPGWLASAFLVSATGCSLAPDGASSDEGPETEGSTTANQLVSNYLTKQQASTVLKLVDDICGDTWCEGDHNFHFDQVQCTRPCGQTPGTCRLAFRIFPYDSDLSRGPTYARTCQTPGFTGFASLVE